MEFISTSEKLSAELGRMMSVLSRKVPLPVLENIYISSDGSNSLELVTTNLETTMRNVMSAEKVNKGGQMLVQAKLFYERVKLLSPGLVTIKVESNKWVTITSGRTKYKIPGADPEEFPTTPRPTKPLDLTFPAKLIKNMVTGVAFAIPPEDDVRYVLKGIKFESDANGIRMVATDGHRLSLTSGKNEELQMEDLDVLIPEKGLEDLIKLSSDTEATVINIAVDGNNVFFQVDQRTLAVKLLEGKFPPYAQIVDDAMQDILEISLPATELAQSLRRARAAADSETHAVLFSFIEGELKLTAQTPRSGSVEEILDAPYTGEGTRVNLHGKYLADYLNSVEGSQVSFGTKDERSPVCLRSIKDNVGFCCVLMSMDPPDV